MNVCHSALKLLEHFGNRQSQRFSPSSVLDYGFWKKKLTKEIASAGEGRGIRICQEIQSALLEGDDEAVCDLAPALPAFS